MAAFNVLLQTNGANERTVQSWISVWLDSSGGHWGNPEGAGGDAWGVTVEDYNYDEDHLRRDVENTQSNSGGQLVNFQIVQQ